MKLGAVDFLSKPVNHDDLERSLKSAIEWQPERIRPRSASLPVLCSETFHGSSPRMCEVCNLVQRTACSDAPVLIQGETGTGKEVYARELHGLSPRSNNPFLKLNCAALPPELVESELFGYERGAFTGAVQRKAGMFEQAHTGTILLDEIGDMPHKLQAKLLQVLQDREFHRLGGKEAIRVDVRVIAATHRDLERAIQSGSFREDLYYRLNVIGIQLPPLRERRDELIPLTQFFLEKYAQPGRRSPQVTPALREAFFHYSWPGNIRELENIVRRLIILGDSDRIAGELNSKSAASAAARGLTEPDAGAAGMVLEQVSQSTRDAEADAILAALHQTHWNRKKAARMLKVHYKALLYKMKKLAIEDKAPSYVPSVGD